MTTGEIRQSQILCVIAIVIAAGGIIALATTSLTSAWATLSVSLLSACYVLWRKGTGLPEEQDAEERQVRAWQLFVIVCMGVYFASMVAAGAILLNKGVTPSGKIVAVGLIGGIYILGAAAMLSIRSRFSDGD